MSGLRSDLIVLLGRLFVSAIFIMSGAFKIFNFNETVEEIVRETLIQPHEFAVAVTCVVILLELAGGLSVAVGFKSNYGAMLLILFLVPTTLMIHDFWTMPQDQVKMEMGLFMRNVSILGGLLLLTVTDSGRFSIDDG